MKYKAVVVDVDGTIIAPGVPGIASLSPRLIKTVRAVQQKGVSVSLATARSLDWVQDVFEALNLQAPSILDNGARIWSPQEQRYLSESYLPSGVAREVIGLLQTYPYQIHLMDNDVRQTFNPQQPSPLTKTVKIMVLHMTPADTEHLYQQLQTINNIQITKSISGDNPIRESIHVTSFDATKDRALEKIAAYFHIQLSEIIGIGDSYNDISFLAKCGLKIAMANAVPEVKALADYITDSYLQDGAAKALEKFILSDS